MTAYKTKNNPAMQQPNVPEHEEEDEVDEEADEDDD